MSEIYIEKEYPLQSIRKFCLEQTSHIKNIKKRIDEANRLYLWIMSGDKDCTEFKMYS